MKRTGSPQTRHRMVRGGMVQNNPPRADRRRARAQAEFAKNWEDTERFINLVRTIVVCGVAFTFTLAVVIVLVIVATL